MRAKVPYLNWRGGRPRWVPGPTLRSRGWRGKDLRAEDGSWLPYAEAMTAALRLNEKVAASLGSQFAAAPRLDKKALDRGFVYFIWAGEQIKIGFSRNPFARARSLSTGVPAPVSAIAGVPGSRQDEARMHKAFHRWHRHGEWFEACPELIDIMMRSIADGKLQFDTRKSAETRSNSHDRRRKNPVMTASYVEKI